ncbi:zinc-binding dehydrogenase [Comamonas badia]|uniref:zinc-binding dehydrogenase n=1 Tax=Comamonas badia TaxID=265291 RepID=UPI002480CBFE|nr:zinc-binding dehydrogenase [Comamonas badia]
MAIGDQVTNVQVGKNYVVYPWHGCGTCKVCRRGDENLCTNGRSLGLFQPGGYADYVLVADARYLVDIGDMSPVQAAPYACSGLTTYSAIRKIKDQVLKDEKVVLFGAGGLGFMAITLIKALGGAGVLVVESDESKHAAVLKVGADAVFNPRTPGVADEIKKAAGGSVWAILDCVGTNQTIQMGMDLLVKGGQLVQIGLFGGHIDISTPFMVLKAMTYQGTYVGNLRELQELVALVKDKQLPAVPTTCMHFSKAFTALLALEQGKAIGRQVLTPENSGA